MDLRSSVGGKELGAFFIVQAGVNINVFFTVFLWMYHKISLCKEKPGEGRERQLEPVQMGGMAE